MPEPQTADTLLKNAYVVTVDQDRRVFTDGYVAFHDGRILAAGSIGEGHHPAVAYGASKAALNKAAALIAGVLQERGVSVVCLCPGRVNTRMGFGTEIEPEESVRGIRKVIDALVIQNTERFLRFNGESISW